MRAVRGGNRDPRCCCGRGRRPCRAGAVAALSIASRRARGHQADEMHLHQASRAAPCRSILALSRHRRRHVHCAGTGVPVLKMTASERRSFRVPARPYPRNGHAVGGADDAQSTPMRMDMRMDACVRRATATPAADPVRVYGHAHGHAHVPSCAYSRNSPDPTHVSYDILVMAY